MAILHQAQLNPSKLQLLQEYLPSVSGLAIDDGSELSLLGAYRFDDPEGEVGIESHLLATVEGRTIHMPVTYRAAPLDDADDWFVGTLEHSALGSRWVYAACGDPVYGPELARTIVTGGNEVKLEVLTDDGVVERERTVHVEGVGASESGEAGWAFAGAQRSGSDTIIRVGTMAVVVHHVLDPGATQAASGLVGTWPGVSTPVTMATVVSS